MRVPQAPNAPRPSRPAAALGLATFIVVAFGPRPGAPAAAADDALGLGSEGTVTVPRHQILRGARKDGIPALTAPRFETADEATWLQDGDRIIGIEHNGAAKAYPTGILVWHEAVNDTLAGEPYLVTY